MFGWRKRRRRVQYFAEVKSQIAEIQTRMVVMVRRELVKHYEVLTASQLAQATVDRLFARPAALSDEYSQLIESLSNVIARENQFVRDASFITLNAMLELEGAENDFKTERRIIETLHWLHQYGEQPMGMTLQQVHQRLMTGEDLPEIAFHKEKEKGT
jgi:hypothetical protein